VSGIEPVSWLFSKILEKEKEVWKGKKILRRKRRRKVQGLHRFEFNQGAELSRDGSVKRIIVESPNFFVWLETR